MTREEAIQVLQTALTSPFIYGEYAEAIEMAIEALTEPINCVKCEHYYETEDNTGVHGHCRMDTAHTDYISRTDAIDKLRHLMPYKKYHRGEWVYLLDKKEVFKALNALPSADAEFADLPDIPRCYYEKVVGKMSHEINILKEQLESADAERGWNNHEVACMLAELFGDTCACNYNSIDEWLPFVCDFKDICPNTVGVACWEQFLTHYGERRGKNDYIPQD